MFPYGTITGKSCYGPGDDYGRYGITSTDFGGPGNSRRTTYVIQLWPYIEQMGLYGQYDFSYNWFAGQNATLCQQQVPMYYCPSDAGAKMWTASATLPETWCRGNYMVNFGNDGFRQWSSTFRGTRSG